MATAKATLKAATAATLLVLALSGNVARPVARYTNTVTKAATLVAN